MNTLALATFRIDATLPLGAPMFGAGARRVASIGSPLELRGLVFLGLDAPVVIACVDWLGIGNDSYALWRSLLADAAGTDPRRVMLSTGHQHSAPMEDQGGDGILEATGSFPLPTIDRAFHRACARRAAAALRDALDCAVPITHVAVGAAEVRDVASNRRILGDDGKVRAVRWSRAGGDPAMAAAPVGLIDPLLRVVGLWNHDRPLAALSMYATHPIGFAEVGEAHWDFVGMARQQRQCEAPDHFHLHLTGCAGNLAPGKFNPGTIASRAALAERLADGMRAAWQSARPQPLTRAEFRCVELPLAARWDDEFAPARLRAHAADAAIEPYDRVRAAYALAWQRRCLAGHHCDLPRLRLNDASILLLPGEPFVEYQLAAQAMRPGEHVLVGGYGDYGPIYIPTDIAFHQGGYEPSGWCYVPPGSEGVVIDALAEALR